MRERKITYFFIVGFLLVVNNLKSQDVWLQNYFAPVSGCDIFSPQTVNVLINNNSGVVIPSGSITVNYTVNGGGLTQQVLATNLFPGASWNFTFDIAADLSACQAHEMMVWVSYASDPNPNNDTLQWIVQNDCTVIPGTVLADDLVCSGANSGTLTLNGWSYGTIADWQQSTNGGGVWTGVGNFVDTYDYLNLTENTMFRVEIDGGFCPNAYSGIATISVQDPPVGGEVQFSETVCEGSTGNLELINHVGTIVSWEFSTNDGTIWNPLAELSTNYNYPAISQTTWYRAVIDGGVCPDEYSDIAIITVDETTQGGIILDNMNICLGDLVDLNLGGYVGDILDWEYSLDNVFFQSLSFTNSNYTDNALTQSTYYRAQVQSGVCPPEYSNTVFVEVHQPVVGGTISGSTDYCGGLGNGSLTLTGWTDQIVFWETSIDDGANWVVEPENSDVFNYSNVSQTTWYRVYVDGDYCPGIYSDTAIVTMNEASDGGIITGNMNICLGDVVDLNLGGNAGDILDWEYSLDNVFFQSLSFTNSNYTDNALTQSTYYRVEVQNGACPSAYSNTVFVEIHQPVVGGTISGSADFCGVLGNGSLTLTGWTEQIIFWETSTDDGSNWVVDPENSDVFNYSNVSQTTWYRVYVDGDYCPGMYSDTAIVTISIGSLAGVLFEDTSLCEGETMDLILMGYIGDIILWETSNDATSWSPLAITADTYTVSPTVDTYYRVIVQSPGCVNDTSNVVLIQVNPLPLVTVGPDVNILTGETTTLSSTSSISGVWSPSSYLSSPFNPNPVAAPPSTITYTYTVVSPEGCENSASVTVFVTDPVDPPDTTETEIPYFLLDIKNVVTTNDDGYNDFWIIEGIENYPSCSVVIFDIYGQEVYFSSHYMNDWDGSMSGKILPNGTYYYVVAPNNTEFLFKGALTLLGND